MSYRGSTGSGQFRYRLVGSVLCWYKYKFFKAGIPQNQYTIAPANFVQEPDNPFMQTYGTCLLDMSITSTLIETCIKITQMKSNVSTENIHRWFSVRM